MFTLPSHNQLHLNSDFLIQNANLCYLQLLTKLETIIEPIHYSNMCVALEMPKGVASLTLKPVV